MRTTHKNYGPLWGIKGQQDLVFKGVIQKESIFSDLEPVIDHLVRVLSRKVGNNENSGEYLLHGLPMNMIGNVLLGQKIFRKIVSEVLMPMIF